MAEINAVKKVRKHSVILSIVLAVAVCYFLVSFFRLRDAIERETLAVNQIKAEIQQQENENKDISRMMEQEQEKKLVERIAREEFGYAYPNEKIYAKSPAGAAVQPKD